MNAFIIFAVVLTIAYIMYYAVMISIDLKTQKSSEADTEENISAGEEEEEEPAVTSRSVVEEPDGGFSFALQDMFRKNYHDHDQVPSVEENPEEAPEDIEEAQQEEYSSTQDHNIPNGIEGTENESNVYSESPEDNDEKSQVSDEEAHSQTTDSDDGLQVLNITPDTAEEKAEQEPYDASSAFDPNLIQPEIGVQTIIGPQASEAACQKASIINESLTKNKARGRIELNSQKFKKWIKDQKIAEKYNIATTNEQNKY